MDWTIVFPFIVSVISTTAVALAWVAKLRWSNEYTAAKEEVLKAKEAQIKSLENEINNLRELTSPKLLEYFTAVKSHLEGFLEEKEKELREAENRLMPSNAAVL